MHLQRGENTKWRSCIGKVEKLDILKSYGKTKNKVYFRE